MFGLAAAVRCTKVAAVPWGKAAAARWETRAVAARSARPSSCRSSRSKAPEAAGAGRRHRAERVSLEGIAVCENCGERFVEVRPNEYVCSEPCLAAWEQTALAGLFSTRIEADE
jgi:hypothetical protein